MPATLKSLTSKVNKLAITIDDDPAAITVWYTTRRLTPKRQREIEQLLKDGASDMDSVMEQFLIMVDRWDFKADEADKEPMSLTRETLENISLEILGEVLDQIVANMRPKEPTDGSSNTP